MLDLIIKNGTVVDGTGKTRYKADIAVKEGVIVSIENNITENSYEVIDAEGLAVSPGFIDNHSHSDLVVFFDNSGYNMLEQGITTEVTGPCGLTIAPYSEFLCKYIGAEVASKEMKDMMMTFTSYSKLFSKIEEIGTGTNMAFYVAHGTVKIAVMGFDNRVPTESEMEKMKELVREGMKSGAIGLSTGLGYTPGVYTEEKEIVELCKVVAEYGGNYTSHIRDENAGVVNSVEEAIRIGENANIPVIISHHKINKRNFVGKSKETLRLIEEANSRGMDVSADMYPYTSGATLLKWQLPSEYTSMGNEEFVNKLKDKDFRQEVKDSMLKPVIVNNSKADVVTINRIISSGLDQIRLLSSGIPGVDAKSITEYASETGQDPFDALFDVLIKSDGKVYSTIDIISNEDMERILKHPLVMFGTDGNVFIKGISPEHPRIFGTFPRILGRYVRENKLISLEEAIRKMTSMPAVKAGLKNKGLIKTGYDADIVVFNPETIIDRADFNNATAKNEGLAYVIVNGKIAVKDNIATGIKAGKVLRRN